MPVSALFGFSGTIDAAISRSQTEIPLVPGYYAPIALGVGDYAYAYLLAGCTVEVVKITALSGDTLTVVRGQSGTEKQAFPRYSSIFYGPTYAEFDERIPFGAPPQLLGDGSVTVDALNVHINELAVTGADFVGGTIAREVNALGCCDNPGLLAPTPENVTDEVTIAGDAPNTSVSAAIPDYFYAYTTAGGTEPRVVTVIDAVLPPGLVISASGVVTGRATTVGSYTFTLQVEDYWGETATLEDTIVVNSVMATFGNAPDWEVNTLYTPYAYTSVNGVPPYTYATTGGTFPTGLVMDAAGVLSGTPTEVGTFTASMSSTDDDGNVATHTDTIEIYDTPGGGPGTEEQWFAVSTLPTGGSSYSNATHTRLPVGAWAAGGYAVHANTPHSLAAIGQRLIGVRKYYGPVYSDDYGDTWQLGLWSGPVPPHADPIHVTAGKAYVPAIVPDTVFVSGNPREAYWTSTNGVVWTQIKPNRGRIYDLSGILSSILIDPTDPDADNPYGQPNVKTRFGQIGIRVVRRLLGKTFLGVRVSKVMRAREVLYIDEGPPRVIYYVPEANRWGGILWKTTDGAGTTEDGPDTWQGGAVAPFDNICALGNTIVVAGHNYEVEEGDDGTAMPHNILGYSLDGGTTFSPATFINLVPFKVEPRTLTVMGGKVYIVGYAAVGGNTVMRAFNSADGQAWADGEAIAAGPAASFAHNIVAAYAGTGVVRGAGLYANSIPYWDDVSDSAEVVATGRAGEQFLDIVRIPDVPVP